MLQNNFLGFIDVFEAINCILLKFTQIFFVHMRRFPNLVK